MVLIDMKVVIRDMLKASTGHFQRNPDGQVVFNDEEIDCWLVFDDQRGLQEPDFLKLSFTKPSPKSGR